MILPAGRWGTRLRALIDCGGAGLWWLGQPRHKRGDRGRDLVAGGVGDWRLGEGDQIEDRAVRSVCLFASCHSCVCRVD